jgi:iron complex transport system permease protein
VSTGTAPRAARTGRVRRPAGHAVVRLRGASLLVHRRAAAVAALLVLALCAAVVAALTLGETSVAPGQVLRVLLGLPSPDALVVGTLRLPRVAVGLLVGAALGVSGALIQSVARNPLASPELIGVTHGAAAATVGAMTFGLVPPALLPQVAVAGGMLAAALVHVVAWRGGLHAHRFVLIGVGISVALGSVTRLFLARGDYRVAQQATVWMTGSLDGRGWAEGAPLAWASAALLPLVVFSAHALRRLSLDDDTARALGVRPGRDRLVLVVTGVALASVATGAAGPVDFVALLAPQVARRLAGTPQIPVAASALLGAFVVTVADLLARRLFSPVELPVGVLTAAVGAPYLIFLLARSRRVGGTG